MALDTKAKRASVAGVGRPWLRNTDPNTAKNARWRASAGNSYSYTGAMMAPVVVGCTVAMDVYQPGADAMQAGCC